MAATVNPWTPPEGMTPRVAAEWRAFYRAALAKYGITPDQYRWLYRLQKGRCAICRKATGKNPDDPRGRGGRRLGIDHNHVTGQVRGLLCSGGDKTCNRIIGWLNAPALRRSADYLEGTQTPGRYLGDTSPGGTVWAETVLWGYEGITGVPVVKGNR